MFTERDVWRDRGSSPKSSTRFSGESRFVFGGAREVKTCGRRKAEKVEESEKEECPVHG